jgi:hypothetical protein
MGILTSFLLISCFITAMSVSVIENGFKVSILYSAVIMNGQVEHLVGFREKLLCGLLPTQIRYNFKVSSLIQNAGPQ